MGAFSNINNIGIELQDLSLQTLFFLCYSDLLQQISREVAQLAPSADLQVAAFLISFLYYNLKTQSLGLFIHSNL